jgi:hypothetical protein
MKRCAVPILAVEISHTTLASQIDAAAPQTDALQIDRQQQDVPVLIHILQSLENFWNRPVGKLLNAVKHMLRLSVRKKGILLTKKIRSQ